MLLNMYGAGTIQIYTSHARSLFSPFSLLNESEPRYYDALVTFNRNVEQYNAVYKLSDAATQAKWKANIDPIIRAASTALDSWKLSLNAPDAASKEAVWQDASKNLLAMLVASGIIKVEGGK